MPNVLTDTRAVERDNPEQLMQELADCEIRLAQRQADYEAKIHEIKAAYEQGTEQLRRQHAAYEARLGAWIMAHRDEFRKPRSKTCPFGTYGLLAVSNVSIDDEEALIAMLEAHGMTDAIRLTKRVDKPALRKLAEASEEPLPGVSIERGDRAFAKIDKALIEAALERNG